MSYNSWSLTWIFGKQVKRMIFKNINNLHLTRLKVSDVQMGNFFMPTIYFLKGNNADNLNLILLGLEKRKGNNSWGINCPFSLYTCNLYKIIKLHKMFPSLTLSPKSHISVLSASRSFRKYIVYNTLPGIEFTILYNGDIIYVPCKNTLLYIGYLKINYMAYLTVQMYLFENWRVTGYFSSKINKSIENTS